MGDQRKYDGLEIAIIGISGQFPGSPDHRAYWKHISEGKELLTTFTDDVLLKSGVPAEAIQSGQYVRTVGALENKDFFDRGFFNYSTEETAFMDPQIRLYHEQCWKALEDAGYAGQIAQTKIGVYSAASENDTWKAYTYMQSGQAGIDPLYLNMLASRQFVSSLVAYRLNLKGPAIYVDTACSSSLVAVHMASRSLLTRECDMALAGGISLKCQQQKGYYYKEGLIRSADGHCRTFDAAAGGTASGEGVGVVVLKRLSEAIQDKDHIYAIIKGSATNNDGNRKVGFTAPSVQGQAECISRALKTAKTPADTITYVEAHGTATRLGDPIEIKALNEAFATGGARKYCAIGSVKTNMGHLDAAAGIAGLIKATLALYHRQLPPTLHFSSPNPEIDFDGGPFFVNTSLRAWTGTHGAPLRAGVSSFGMGGTNAHVILEEAPPVSSRNAPGTHHLLTLSARTTGALERYVAQLQQFLETHPHVRPDDLAYTLQTGRKHFPYRKALVFRNQQELKRQLATAGAGKEAQQGETGKPVVFMFPGQGTQYVQMAKGLYTQYPVFRQHMDAGFSLIGEEYKQVLFGEDATAIQQTKYTQPLIFLLEYALAQLLLTAGIKPRYMIGHSIGEYVCACLDGVFSFEDALRLVVARGRLMNALPAGAMLSAAVSGEEAAAFLSPGLNIAAINGPQQTVFSGEQVVIDRLAEQLQFAGVVHTRLRTSHAFHSAMMDPILDAFREELQQVVFHQPVQTSFISNLSGRLILPEEAASPAYWVSHLRGCVQFAAGIATLLTLQPRAAYIEVGAGMVLGGLLKQVNAKERPFTVNLVRTANDSQDDELYLLTRLGQLWEAGVIIDWAQLHQHSDRRRISLPGYSFEQVRYTAEVPMPFAGGQQVPVVINVPEQVVIDRPALSNTYQAPSNETETILTGMLEALFGMKQIGVEDNFFELGGDSLKAMALLGKIKERFNLTIALKDLFSYKDVKQLAAEIDEKQWLGTESDKQFTTII